MATKQDDAREILRALGMPLRQQNENAIYTLLAFANVGPETPWASASGVRRTPHEVIQFAKSFGKIYAENTRETIRRQAIHQLVQGGVLVRNPDDAGLATNSPRTHYRISAEAIDVIRAYGTDAFVDAAAQFLGAVDGGLAARYARSRTIASIPVTLPGGRALTLSPGAHNRLQAAIVEQFLPQFAAGAEVLYLGDTAHKSLHVETRELAELGVPVTQHDKLPDVVAYLRPKNWLYLIEAVTSHGPVSPKRLVELQSVLKACSAGPVYVSAFHTFREFKRHAGDIAWETEVWVADAPTHLLHYNGDRFFGPRG